MVEAQDRHMQRVIRAPAGRTRAAACRNEGDMEVERRQNQQGAFLGENHMKILM